jgi:hypothetical protein
VNIASRWRLEPPRLALDDQRQGGGQIAAGGIARHHRRPAGLRGEIAPGGDAVLHRRRERMLRRQPIIRREDAKAALREGPRQRPMGLRRAADEAAAVQVEHGFVAASLGPFAGDAAHRILAEAHAGGRRQAAALEHALELFEIAHVAEALAHRPAYEDRDHAKLQARRQGASAKLARRGYADARASLRWS